MSSGVGRRIRPWGPGLVLMAGLACDHGRMDDPPAGPEHIAYPSQETAEGKGGAPAPAGVAGEGPADAPSMSPRPSGMAGPGGAMNGPPTGAAPVGGTDAGQSIAGTLSLAPGLQAASSATAVIFVIARPEGMDKGPPIATARYPVGSFPIAFRLGSENVMMQGTPFQGKVSLSARLDSDGNAMTRGAGDIAGTVPAPVEVGRQDVQIVLDQPL